MSRNAGRRSMEVIGVLGVIGSLIFVGLEVRESSRATRAATDAEIAAQFVEINTAIYASGELAEDFTAASEAGHPSRAPAASQIRIRAHFRALFHVWSNTHRQHLNGTVNPLLFEAVEQELTAYATPESPDASDGLNDTRRVMQWVWASERFLYNPAFQSLVDSTLASRR